MKTTTERIGAALAKAVKKTAAKMTPAKDGTAMYRTNLRHVPKVEGLARKDGWVDMQVQFLIDKKSAGADHVVGWTVLKPGARHERQAQRGSIRRTLTLCTRSVSLPADRVRPMLSARVTQCCAIRGGARCSCWDWPRDFLSVHCRRIE